MRCKHCQYSLKGLTEHRCPECGTPFDPNAVEPYPPLQFPGRHLLIIVGVACCLGIALTVNRWFEREVAFSHHSRFDRWDWRDYAGFAGSISYMAVLSLMLLYVPGRIIQYFLTRKHCENRRPEIDGHADVDP